VIAKHYEGREFNIETLMAHTALDVVGRAFFGMEFANDRLTVLTQAVNDASEFSQKLINSVIPMTWLPTEINRRGKRAVAVFYDVFDELIDEGLARPFGEDLLSVLLESVKSGAFDRKQLSEELWTIVNAGHETTATTMAVMLYHFAKDPSWQAEVVADIDEILGDADVTFEKLGRLTKMDWTTKETLRLYPPASGTARQAVAHDELDGFHIPKGSILQASFHWMQRDSSLWSDANDFHAARFADAKAEKAGAYLPFGGGPRRCLGEHFAYLEALIIVTKILQQYTVECRDDFVVEPYLRVATRMRNGVHLTLRRRAR
jgi:enediyne biosynthesis protein E7